MIGNSDFRAAVAYIVREGPQHEREHEPPLAVWCDNVASIETAALEMTATASQSRAKDSLFHLIVSWDEGERPTYEEARAALDAQMRHLGLNDLQYVAALQNDGVGGKYHIHSVINRVDPETHVARDMWQSKERMQAACREVELEQGWRVVESPTRSQGRSRGARDVEYYAHRQSFERRVREELGPALREQLAKDGATWATLHAFCREQGIRYEPVMRQSRADGETVFGGRLTGTERGEFARARDLGEDLTHPKLLERLGAYEPDRVAQVRLPFAERCRAAVLEIERLRNVRDEPGWERVHAAFERQGLAYEAVGTGAHIADLDGPETVKPSALDRQLSMSAMCARFGAFETTTQARERVEAREVVRHAESLVVGARLIEDPSSVLERLTATRATFTLRDAERAIEERVRDREQRQVVLEAVVAQSVVLTGEKGGTRLTTAAVLEAERSLDAAARGLAETRQKVVITRTVGAHLDEQQRRAYAYAVADDSRLKVVRGVPGAGKTTLIADVAAAYEDAGYRVRAVSVAHAAVQVLQRETGLPARSIAKELHEWGQGREQLGGRDVLIVDEVSTLGTAQGAQLLAAAHERGAVVLAFGDDKQFQAVAHGNALAFMQRAVGTQTVDLTQTRRQREEWQREATHAVRRGDVRAALEAYRGAGCIREHDTQAQARTAIVGRWAQIEGEGTECGIEAFTNAERIAVNALAREQWRGMGRLSGADVHLETIDGLVPYAVGDRVVMRETIREAGLFNGSVGTVRGIDGARLAIERRDGEIVRVDTGAYPGVQHGYCSTEYREQGSTRYAELQLVTQHVNQRSLTVGMTRHTHAYEMFYARETVGSYEELVGLGMRTRSKDLASDYRVHESQRETLTVTRDAPTHQHEHDSANQRYALLRAELREVKVCLHARDAQLEDEGKTLLLPTSEPSVSALVQVERERAVAEAQDRARAYTPQERDMHDEILRRRESRNPLARVGLERLERELANEYAQRLEHATSEAHRTFEASGEHARIEYRWHITQAEHAQTRERFAAITEERKDIASALGVAEGARWALDALEREGIPPPVVALRDAARSPAESAQRIAEEIKAARASVGYEKQRAQLKAFSQGLVERAASLEREQKNLGFVAPPEALEVQRDTAWKAFLEETKRAACFTAIESQQIREAQMQREHWNPLTRRDAERTERVIVNTQALREREALEGAHLEFKARELPQIMRRFEEQRDARATWEARYAKLADAEHAVERGFGMFGAAHADLTAMEQAGVSWRELDQEMGARECVHVEALRTQIAAAKGALTREMSVTAMRWELEPIARGEVHGYEDEERKAASMILKQLKGVNQDARMCVSRDTHLVLQEPENVHEQVRHIEHEQKQELSRGMSMGRGM